MLKSRLEQIFRFRWSVSTSWAFGNGGPPVTDCGRWSSLCLDGGGCGVNCETFMTSTSTIAMPIRIWNWLDHWNHAWSANCCFRWVLESLEFFFRCRNFRKKMLQHKPKRFKVWVQLWPWSTSMRPSDGMPPCCPPAPWPTARFWTMKWKWKHMETPHNTTTKKHKKHNKNIYYIFNILLKTGSLRRSFLLSALVTSLERIHFARQLRQVRLSATSKQGLTHLSLVIWFCGIWLVLARFVWRRSCCKQLPETTGSTGSVLRKAGCSPTSLGWQRSDTKCWTSDSDF